MKNILFLFLLFITNLSFAHVNCTTIQLISATNNSITLHGPTTNDCENPTYQIMHRIAGSMDSWETTNFSKQDEDFVITIEDLEACSSYEFRISVFCDGELVGGCQTSAYETSCCENCIRIFGIESSSKGCEAEFVLDFQVGECGAIQPISYDWDFGFSGVGGTGMTTDFVANATYPHDGTYTVTCTITYQVVGTDEICTATESTTITITDCATNCDDCINIFGIETSSKGCEAELFLDFQVGDCGAIQPLSYDWDFGFSGVGGTGMTTDFIANTTYPHDGTFTVTCTITFRLLETGEVCTSTATTTITITDCATNCDDCINIFGIVTSSKGCEAELILDFQVGDCGAIIPISYDWDFGYMGGQTPGGFWETTTYPHDGTFTVTCTITFKLLETGEVCTSTETTTITITDCATNCEDCINIFGIVSSFKGCEAEFVLDFQVGDCGAIIPLSYDWDFGYMGGQTPGGFWVTTTYPNDGTYIVTATITFKLVETGEICTVTTSTTVVVEDCGCGSCLNVFGLEVSEQRGCDVTLVYDFNVGECFGPITINGVAWSINNGAPDFSPFEIITLNFPCNGDYLISATISFTDGMGQTCRYTYNEIITVTDCTDCLGTGGGNPDRSTVIEQEEISSVELFPNPMMETATLKFFLQEASATDIQVFDTNGKLIRSYDRSSNAGENTQNIDLRGEHSGMYYYIINANDQQFRGKILKQ